MSAPSEAELFALAERALGYAGEEAQVTAWWERAARAGRFVGVGLTERTAIEVACVRDGGVGTVLTTALDDEGLSLAARGAERLAERAEGEHPGLPGPLPGRAHDGWDPSALRTDPAELALELGGEVSVSLSVWAARTAIVSTTGVHAFEQRSRAARFENGLEQIALRLQDLPAVEQPPIASGSEAVKPGEYAAVLGHDAVALALRPFGHHLFSPSGALATRLGTRIVAPCVSLSESPRYPGTLPRSYDAEGVPRQPVPLIQDGVAHRTVQDTASAARAGGAARSTGHASESGLRRTPAADHLVLVGGGAADVEELAAPLAAGLYVRALHWRCIDSAGHVRALTHGARRILDGRLGAALAPQTVEFDTVELFAAAQALTMAQRTLPAGPADRSARTAGATVCPAVRFGGGLRVR